MIRCTEFIQVGEENLNWREAFDGYLAQMFYSFNDGKYVTYHLSNLLNIWSSATEDICNFLSATLMVTLRLTKVNDRTVDITNAKTMKKRFRILVRHTNGEGMFSRLFQTIPSFATSYYCIWKCDLHFWCDIYRYPRVLSRCGTWREFFYKLLSHEHGTNPLNIRGVSRLEKQRAAKNVPRTARQPGLSRVSIISKKF